MCISVNQIIQIVTHSTAEIIEKALNAEIDFYDLSKKIVETTNAINIEMTQQILEQLDQKTKRSKDPPTEKSSIMCNAAKPQENSQLYKGCYD